MDRIVNPEMEIPDDAAEIHGITDGLIRRVHAPTLRLLAPRLIRLLQDRPVIAWNTSFMRRALPPVARYVPARWHCLMERFTRVTWPKDPDPAYASLAYAGEWAGIRIDKYHPTPQKARAVRTIWRRMRKEYPWLKHRQNYR